MLQVIACEQRRLVPVDPGVRIQRAVGADHAFLLRCTWRILRQRDEARGQRELLRLWSKHWDTCPCHCPPTPQLPIAALKAALEVWPTAKLVRLWRGHVRTGVDVDQERTTIEDLKVLPGGEATAQFGGRLPIVVVRQEGSEHLIDGATRVNECALRQVQEPYPVILLEAGR